VVSIEASRDQDKRPEDYNASQQCFQDPWMVFRRRFAAGEGGGKGRVKGGMGRGVNECIRSKL